MTGSSVVVATVEVVVVAAFFRVVVGLVGFAYLVRTHQNGPESGPFVRGTNVVLTAFVTALGIGRSSTGHGNLICMRV